MSATPTQPTAFDWTLYRNADYKGTVTLKDVNAVAIDLSDYEQIWLTAKRSPTIESDDDAVFQLTLGHGLTLKNQTTNRGQVEVVIADSDLTSLGWSEARLYADVWAKNNLGAMEPLMVGFIRVKGHPTRSSE